MFSFHVISAVRKVTQQYIKVKEEETVLFLRKYQNEVRPMMDAGSHMLVSLGEIFVLLEVCSF